VGDPTAEPGLAGELLVEMETVGVARRLRERADVRVVEHLPEADDVAHVHAGLVRAGVFELPVAVVVEHLRRRRLGPVGGVGVAPGDLREVLREIGRRHDAHESTHFRVDRRARFGLGFTGLALVTPGHHVAVDDREPSDVVRRERFGGLLEGDVRSHRHDVLGHDVCHERVVGVAAAREEAHDVALGHDADRARLLVADDERADAVAVEALGHGPDGRCRADRLHVRAHDVAHREGDEHVHPYATTGHERDAVGVATRQPQARGSPPRSPRTAG